MICELWALIPGHPNYLVSDHGRVWSRLRTRPNGQKDGGKYLQGYWNPRGYNLVGLDGGVRFVHRMVLSAFVRLPLVDEQGRHLDGNPGNNFLSNLAWGTAADNAMDKIRHGNSGKLENCHRGHPLEGDNLYEYENSRNCKSCAKLKYLDPEFKERRNARLRAKSAPARAAREAAKAALLAQIIDLHEQGLAVGEIAKRVGRSHSAVSNYLQYGNNDTHSRRVRA